MRRRVVVGLVGLALALAACGASAQSSVGSVYTYEARSERFSVTVAVGAVAGRAPTLIRWVDHEYGVACYGDETPVCVRLNTER